MHDTERQNGPDFLDSFAEQNLAHGLDTNAGEFRARAKDWREDQQRIADLEAVVADQARRLRTQAERERAITDIKQHLQAANDLLDHPTAASAA